MRTYLAYVFFRSALRDGKSFLKLVYTFALYDTRRREEAVRRDLNNNHNSYYTVVQSVQIHLLGTLVSNRRPPAN